MEKGRERHVLKPTCYDCIYAYWDPGLWMTSLSTGFPHRPICANHPDSPSQLRPISPGGVCRNYRPKPATPAGNIERIPLSRGYYAFVDAADYEWLNRYRWFYYNGYAARREGGKTVFMHRQIMQPPDGMFVDHIDGNRANNCRFNLRVCTRRENLRNQRKRAGCLSRYKGVSYDRRDENWFATIYYDDRSVDLGSFKDEVEAARAYDRRAIEVFGPYARPNFPEDWPPELRQKVHAAWLKAHPQPKAKRPKAPTKKVPSRPKSPARRAGRTRNRTRKLPKRKPKKPPRD